MQIAAQWYVFFFTLNFRVADLFIIEFVIFIWFHLSLFLPSLVYDLFWFSRLGFHKPPFISVGHLHLHVLAPATHISQSMFYRFTPGTDFFITVSPDGCSFLLIHSTFHWLLSLAAERCVCVRLFPKNLMNHRVISIPSKNVRHLLLLFLCMITTVITVLP